MTPRRAHDADRDWWTPHVLLTVFAVLVAAILRAVPGWSAPLQAWITLAGCAIAALSADAALRCATRVARGRWHQAGVALALAAALGAASAVLLGYGRSRVASADDAFRETPFAPETGP